MAKKSMEVVLDREEEVVEAKPPHFNQGRENKRAGRNPLPAEGDRFAFEIQKGDEGLYRVVMYRLNYESRRYRPIFEGEYREKIGALAEFYNIVACNKIEDIANESEQRNTN
jgi:hypothetical protein